MSTSNEEFERSHLAGAVNPEFRRIVTKAVDAILAQFKDHVPETNDEFEALRKALELQKLLDEIEINELMRVKVGNESKAYAALEALKELLPELLKDKDRGRSSGTVHHLRTPKMPQS